MRRAGFPLFSRATVNAPALALLLATAVLAGAAERSKKAPAGEGPDWIPFDDPGVLEVLKKSEAAGAYDIPDINLKKDSNYANTSVDVEPFGGAKPYKENFLTQLTYWGAGRAKPEPENLASVKVGFIGPIHADGLDRHRRQEPRGGARRADAAGRAARGRGVERPRRLPEAQDPVRALGEQRQRPLGLLRQRDHQAGLHRPGLGDHRHDRRRQQPHRDPGRAEGRGRDDQHRRHRPHLHRDEHPVGRARDRGRPAAGVPAHRLLVPQAGPQARGDRPREQPLRPLRRARGARQRPAHGPPDPDRDGVQGRPEGLQARGRAREEVEPRRGRALGQRRRGCPGPQHDARDGDDAAVLRLRPHGVRRVRQDRGEERGGRRGRFPVGPDAQERAAGALPHGLPRAVGRRGRDLRGARLRRHEPHAVVDPGGRPQPREDARPDRAPAPPLARGHGRHRPLRRARRRRRHDARPVRGRPLGLPHEGGAAGAAGLHPAPGPAEPRCGGGEERRRQARCRRLRATAERSRRPT